MGIWLKAGRRSTEMKGDKLMKQGWTGLLTWPFRNETVIYIGLGLFLGLLMTQSAFAGVFAVLGLVLVFAVYDSPLKALAILVLFFPFARHELFYEPIAMKGTEPVHLLSLLVICVAFLNYRKSVKLSPFTVTFITLFLVLFTVAVVRSVSYAEIFSARNIAEGRGALSSTSYFLRTYVRPMLYFMPLIIIVKFCREKKQLDFLFKVVVFALFALSLYCAYIFVFRVPDVTNVGLMNMAFGENIGMLRNELANFFIMGFPFLLARYFLKKDAFSIIAIVLSCVAIGFSYSRTAYVLLIFSLIFYLFVSKRKKWMPVLVVLGLAASVVMSSAIIERASKGFGSDNLTEITAGRTGNIWLPLIEEWLRDPTKLFFGAGRSAIVYSDSVRRGVAPGDIFHPHNMYLEQLLDIGLVGLVITMTLFGILTLRTFRSLRTIQDSKLKEYQCAMIVSMSSFYLAGLTGRTLFPSDGNTYFWVVLGMTIVITRLSKKSEENSEIGETIEKGEIENRRSTMEMDESRG